MKKLEEMLDLLPEYIAIPKQCSVLDDEFDRKDWYLFDLTKRDGQYELSYYCYLKETDLASFVGGLYEVVSKMYEWCRDNGYL